MRVLFLENDDSFSWNVLDALPVARTDIVLRHVRHEPVEDEALDAADVLVIGPGPMDPYRVGLVTLVRKAAERRLPTLGVCLGHQAIGLAFGAKLIRTAPVHGKTSTATFSPSFHFPGFEGGVQVMRYHSLALTEVPPPLAVVARSEDGVVMALEHTALPMAGVQFHPDSYATPRGRELFAAFFRSVR